MPKKIIKRKTTHVSISKAIEQPKRSFNPRWLLVLGLFLVLTAALAWKNKGLFVAATVNGRPILRLELDQRLVSRFGDQTLDEMVGEVLIRQAASQNKITVSKAELDNKIAEIEKTLNGQITLKDALAQQGDTVESFRQRVELQLLLEKLTVGQVNVTDQEVSDYIEKNKSSLVASDEAAMKKEAKDTLVASRQNTVLRQYFSDLKTKAKVAKFL